MLIRCCAVMLLLTFLAACGDGSGPDLDEPASTSGSARSGFTPRAFHSERPRAIPSQALCPRLIKRPPSIARDLFELEKLDDICTLTRHCVLTD